MKCKDCPARGQHETNWNMCFCAGKGTSKIRLEDDCKYGIENYDEYWIDLCEKENERWKNRS